MIKQVFAIGGLIFLAIGGALVVYSVRRGRRIATWLAQRHPQLYETIGRPEPGYLHSIRRSRFDQFILQRQYLQLGDEEFTAQCDRLRRTNLIILYFILAGLTLFGAAAMWYEWQG